jgi:hypothetical protein
MKYLFSRILFNRDARGISHFRHMGIILISILLSAVFITADGIILPHVKYGASPLFETLQFVSFACLAALMSGLVWSAACLLRRRWSSSLCYFVAALLAPASMYASLALKGDRFTFTNGPHREIAEIYNGRRSEFARMGPSPNLIDIGNQCHPPNGCGCWIVVDPMHASGIDEEIRGWHRPNASIFPMYTYPRNFEIVNVRRLDGDAYSVLGCEADFTALKPV